MISTHSFVFVTFAACIGITFFALGVAMMRAIKFIGSDLIPRVVHLTSTTFVVCGIVILETVIKAMMGLAVWTFR